MSSYQDKMMTLKDDDRNLANSYFTKAYKMENMFELVRANLPLKDPIGNFNSDVVCILDFDKVNDKAVRVLQKFYEVNKGSVFSSYITPYFKTNNNGINTKLLTNELQIIAPKRVAILGANVEHIEINCISKTISNEYFTLFMDCLGDQEKMKNPEYQKAKQEFNEMMKFIILGV